MIALMFALCLPALTVHLPDGRTIQAQRVELRGDVVTVIEGALFRDGFE